MARLIVLEGGEGVGKSTQAAILAKQLGAVLTREPGGTWVGEALRKLVLGAALPAPTPKAETLLMLAARAQHVAEVIEPALAAGRDVVCDRYSGSTLAYQGYGRGISLDELASLDNWATGGRKPDLVILLDAPVKLGRLRRLGDAADRFEGEADEFLEKVRAGFLALAAEGPALWRIVDASGEIEEVAAKVRMLAQ